jgi:multidrug efflux pump subunit AcrB
MLGTAVLDVSINMMTLLAFIVVLGMLDDDSVVVAENIYRHLEMGQAPVRAAIDGAREVAFPVLASVAMVGAVLFNSYLQPFVVLGLTIPTGVLGAIYALLLHGEPFSFMAVLGIVALLGVVINNAIVLVSFINQLRATGMALETACLEAGCTRLRPIWASSITTLAGLLPTAYSWSGGEPFVQPMARTMAWGLAFAMPFTLFLIPMGILLVEDGKRWVTRIVSRPGTKSAPDAPVAAGQRPNTKVD